MIRDTFIQEPEGVDEVNKSHFNGIVDKEKWSLNRIAELVGTRQEPAVDDPFPTGTQVEFHIQDGVRLAGKVASKSGEDYIVEVDRGESYLVPPKKISKVTPESETIREAIRREITPDITVVSEHTTTNQYLVRVAYTQKRPTDDQLTAWASTHYDGIRLVDAKIGQNRTIDLVFEINAAEDVKPQGGDQNVRGVPLSSEEIEGTGVIADEVPGTIQEAEVDEVINQLEEAIQQLEDHKETMSQEETVEHTMSLDDITKESQIQAQITKEMVEEGVAVELEHTDDKDIARQITVDHLSEDKDYYSKLKKMEAQLGIPGAGDQYDDLTRAARWVLTRFNDNNPEIYAVPQEIEMAGDGDNRVIRLSFSLYAKDEKENLSDLYINRQGQIVPDEISGALPARGFVQVDSAGSMPAIMVQGPMGPDAVQSYGFSLAAAQSDMCAALAEQVLSEFGGYSSEAEAEFNARLTKLAVDPKAKSYWKGYFKDYGGMLTRDVPKKKHASVDAATKKYWTEYFGSSVFDDGWYGDMLVRDMPRATHEVTTKSAQKKIKYKYQPPKKQLTYWDQLLEQKKQQQYKTVQDAGQIASGLLTLARTKPEINQYLSELSNKILMQDSELKSQVDQRFPSETGDSFALNPAARAYIITYGINKNKSLLNEAYSKLQQTRQAQSDYAAYIKKEDGKYCVKSKSNQDWSGGCYDSKEKAEERLKQVEMFKHMSVIACSNPDMLYRHISAALLIDDNPIGVLNSILKLAQNDSQLEQLVRDTIAKSHQDESLRQQLIKLHYGYLHKHPELETRLLRGTEKVSLTEDDVAKVIYTAIHERSYFNQFKKILDQQQKREQEKQWKGLREERKELHKKTQPSLFQRVVSPIKKLFEEPAKQPQQEPVEMGQAVEESMVEPEVDVSPSPPTPPEEIEVKPEDVEIIEEPEVVEEQKPEPEVSEDKRKKVLKSQEERAKIKQEAKDFLKPGSPKQQFMKSVLEHVPYPIPETPEQEQYYKENKRKRWMGMSVKQIADQDPWYAYENLARDLRKQDEAAYHALMVYLKNKDELGKLIPGLKKTKKTREESYLSADDIQPTKLDSHEISGLSGMTFPDIIKLTMDKPNKLDMALSYMLNNDPDKFEEWANAALPTDVAEELIEKMRESQPAGKQEQTIPETENRRQTAMRKWSKAGPGPHAYNAPGKDDKEDYDHKDRNKQQPRNKNKFCLNRYYSTTSSEDNGYIIMEISWEPEQFEGMSPQNVQHQLISYVKGLESDKHYHDFGVLGRARVIDFDVEAGIARIKVRSSESRNVTTLNYNVSDKEMDKYMVPVTGVR